MNFKKILLEEFEARISKTTKDQVYEEFEARISKTTKDQVYYDTYLNGEKTPFYITLITRTGAPLSKFKWEIKGEELKFNSLKVLSFYNRILSLGTSLSYALENLENKLKKETDPKEKEVISKYIEDLKKFKPIHLKKTLLKIVDKELEQGNVVSYEAFTEELDQTYSFILARGYKIFDVGETKYIIGKKGD